MTDQHTPLDGSAEQTGPDTPAGEAAGVLADTAAATPADEAADQQSRDDLDIERLRSMIGSNRDIADGAIPSIVFVVANMLWSLQVAALAATAYGVAVTVYRLVRKQGSKRALLGLAGVAFAVGIALWTGEASAYFVPGVVIGTLVGLATLLSVVLRQPSSAMFAMALEKKPAAYYARPDVRRAHMIVTTLWGLVFLGRAGLRAYLIANDEVELLGLSAIVLGYPLTLGVAAVSVLYLRRLGGSVGAETA